jgi:ParB-like chromosome segregation protein Spo0J
VPVNCKTLALEYITEDPRLRGRPLKPSVVNDYVAAMRRGEVFPPIKVVCDDKDNYYLVDGYHRLAATRELNGVDTIQVEIVDGTFDKALWLAWGANRDHGLRRTQKQKREATRAALRHPEWGKKTDRAIAKHIGCDHKTVASMRRNLLDAGGEFPTGSRKPKPSKKQVLKACQTLASAQPEHLGPFERAESAILRAGYKSLGQLLTLADPQKPAFRSNDSIAPT